MKSTTRTTPLPTRLDQCGEIVSREEVMSIFRIGSLTALYALVEDPTRGFPAAALTHPLRWFRADLERWRDRGLRAGASSTPARRRFAS